MWTSWRLRKNSEIRLWLWKVWSLVVCSQSSFYVTRARKDDKNRQNALLLWWKRMNLLPDKQTFIKIPSQNNSLPITVTCTKNSKDFILYGINVPRSYWLFYYNISLLFSSSSNFSQTDNTLFYNQHNAVYSLQQRNTVDFGLWSWFSSFERKGSRWKPYNQFPGNIAGSLVFVAVPQTSFFAESLASRSHGSEQVTFEMREEVLSSVGAQDTDTGGYELSNIEGIEVSREVPAVDMDSVYRPRIDTPFSPSIVDDFQMEEGSTTANPKLVEDEEYKEKSAPTTSTTPESERQTEPPRWLRSRPFWARLEIVPDPVYRTLFH